MKRFFILLILITIVTTSFAQRRSRGGSTINWLSIALKGGYGNTIMFHEESMNHKGVTYDMLSPSYFVGGRLGWTYGDYIGLSFELTSAKYTQKYDLSTPTIQYSKDTKFKTRELLVLFRYTGSYGFYLELGPKFSTMKAIDQSSSISVNGDGDVLSKYTKKYTSGVFGLGFMPLRTERITASLGLRAAYSFSDVIADDNYYALNDGTFIDAANFKNKQTNPFSAQVVLEFNYFFGFWGDASCGRGKLVFFK